VTACKKGYIKWENADSLRTMFGYGVQERKAYPDLVHFFIDGSGSMHGYSDPAGDFIPTINKIVNLMSQFKEDQIIFSKFGASCSSLTGDLKSILYQIAKREFYSEERTDISKPIDVATMNKNTLNIVFTDGLQSTSNPEADFIMLARAIKGYLGTDGFIRIYGKLAPFEGRYYSLTGKKWIQIPKGSKRPLFCMVFGKQQYASFAEEIVSNQFEHMFEIGISNPNNLQYETKQLDKAILHYEDIRELKLSNLELKQKSDTLSIALIGKNEPVHNEVSYSILFSNNHKRHEFVNHSKGKSDVIRDEDRILIHIPYKEAEKGLYLIQLAFIRQLPEWIQSWDTKDDSSLENVTKSLNLKLWAETILSSFKDDIRAMTSTEYYIQIVY